MTGRQKSLTEQLLGTWTLVSHRSLRLDGSEISRFGDNPKGIAIFDSGGRYILSAMHSDRAKYAIGDPAQGTADENKLTAQGTMTYFGRYTVSEADHIISIHIEACSFPNWNDTNQNRIFSIVGNQLTLTAHAPETGAIATVVWKRAE